MKQYFGMSQTGNLKEAAQGVHAPGLLILMSNADQFEAHVTELESLFPGVPSIGCIGMSYSTRVVEKGVGLVAAGIHHAGQIYRTHGTGFKKRPRKFERYRLY